MLKTLIFGKKPWWKCSKRPFSVKNRGGNAQNGHFPRKTVVFTLKMVIFPSSTVVLGSKMTIFPSPTMVLCFKMTVFTVATSVLPLKTSVPLANFYFSHADSTVIADHTDFTDIYRICGSLRSRPSVRSDLCVSPW